MKLPRDLPQSIKDALAVFTPKELDSLYSAYMADTGEFMGVGFNGPDGHFTRFADPIKAAAIKKLEDYIRAISSPLNSDIDGVAWTQDMAMSPDQQPTGKLISMRKYGRNKSSGGGSFSDSGIYIRW